MATTGGGKSRWPKVAGVAVGESLNRQSGCGVVCAARPVGVYSSPIALR